MLGIIGAMRLETKILISAMTDVSVRTISGMEFTRGKLDGQDVVVSACGVGKVFAAMCAQTMILEYAPSAVINTGVAGGAADNLHVGDIVAADRVIQHDMDVTALGLKRGEHMELRVGYFPCAPQLINGIKSSADELGYTCRIGTIASGDRFISSSRDKNDLRDSFGAAAAEMEGAAIGQVCYVNGVPFAVVRAISDGADGDAKMSFEEFSHMAAERSANVLRHMLRHI